MYSIYAILFAEKLTDLFPKYDSRITAQLLFMLIPILQYRCTKTYSLQTIMSNTKSTHGDLLDTYNGYICVFLLRIT